MKTIENKTTEIPKEEGVHARYSDIIEMILNSPPKEGFSFAEIKKRERIEVAVKQALDKEEVIKLEDSDWEHLKRLCENTQFRFRHKDLLAFHEDVLKA